MEDDIYIKTGRDIYIHMLWSSNPPYFEDADGVIGIYVFDEEGREHPSIEGGELDIYGDGDLNSYIEDVLSFIDAPSDGYELISEDDFPEEL